jgi:polysaccharide biosynthesis/export protein
MTSLRKPGEAFVRAVLCCVVAGASFLAGGCASKGPRATTSVENLAAQESSTKQEIRAINDKLFASVSSTPQMQDYVIGEGDLVQISVFEAQELNTETRVGARGFITLALVGPVELKGLTTREAEQKVEDLYRQRYMQSPHVGVFVKEQIAGRVTLMGAVKKPGKFPYLAKQQLFDVLAMAEGLADNAGRMVQVRRQNEDKSRPTTFIADLNEMINEGNLDLNIDIKAGDVVYVPEAGMVYVDGAVRKPGNYPIKKAMSVQEAITAAGGFNTIADEGKIKLVRADDKGKREVVQLNFKDIAKDADRNINLKDRDVVFVETNTTEALIYGLHLNLGSGLFGVGYQPPTTPY